MNEIQQRNYCWKENQGTDPRNEVKIMTVIQNERTEL